MDSLITEMEELLEKLQAPCFYPLGVIVLESEVKLLRKLKYLANQIRHKEVIEFLKEKLAVRENRHDSEKESTA